MQNTVDAFERRDQVVQPHQVGLDDPYTRVVLQMGDGLGRAEGEIVEEHHFADACLEQAVGGVRADETGCAGDQDARALEVEGNALLCFAHVSSESHGLVVHAEEDTLDL